MITETACWNTIAIPAWKMALAWSMATPLSSNRRPWCPFGVAIDRSVDSGRFAQRRAQCCDRFGAVGDTLVSSKQIAGVSFTGSVNVGMGIYEKAMKNLTRVQLEWAAKTRRLSWQMPISARL